MKKIAILGATGTIGDNCLNVIRNHKDDFKIVLLTGYSNVEKLNKLANEFNVKNISTNLEIFPKLIKECDADIVLNGIAGSAGLISSLAAIEAKKTLALANKETIVMGGKIILDLAKKNEVKILPIDSEHAALFELSKLVSPTDIKKVIITASGGPFRDLPLEKFSSIKLEDALKHPTWKMGKKITIDSATMANKGLEVIEAKYLFNLPTEKIDVLIHPESKFHAMLQTNENSFYAQISNPSMQIPIQNALSYPNKITSNTEELDFTNTSFSFKKPNYQKYPMLKLAYECANNGLCYTIAYNDINEIVVDKFMKEEISYVDIYDEVKKRIDKIKLEKIETIDDILNFHNNIERLI